MHFDYLEKNEDLFIAYYLFFGIIFLSVWLFRFFSNNKKGKERQKNKIIISLFFLFVSLGFFQLMFIQSINPTKKETIKSFIYLKETLTENNLQEEESSYEIINYIRISMSKERKKYYCNKIDEISKDKKITSLERFLLIYELRRDLSEFKSKEKERLENSEKDKKISETESLFNSLINDCKSCNEVK